MVTLKLLKELEAYIKVKDYIEENNVKIEDLLESFDTKCVHVTVESNGVSKKFYYLTSVAHYMNVSLATIYYAHAKKRDTIRKMKGEMKVFYLKWE